MSNILTAMMNQEKAQRELVQAVLQSEVDEHTRVVRAIHKAYAPYSEQVQSLVLLGDYSEKIIFGKRSAHDIKVETAYGLIFHTGSRICREEVKLSVSRREGAVPGKITLSLVGHHPHPTNVIETFAIDTPAEHLVAQTFAVLMRFLHPSAFPASQPEALAA